MTTKSRWLRGLRSVRCRDIGHAWTEGGGVQRVAPGVTGRELTCEECTTTRIDIYDRVSGELIMRRYIYPDWYKKPTDLERIPPRQFRIKAFRRQPSQKATPRMEFIWDKKPGWRDL